MKMRDLEVGTSGIRRAATSAKPTAAHPLDTSSTWPRSPHFGEENFLVGVLDVLEIGRRHLHLVWLHKSRGV